MNYKILRGFCLGGGIDLHPGQTIDTLTPGQADLYLRQGRIEPAGEPAPVNMAKASLLATIALAESIEDLNELVTKDESDQEVITAYLQRASELEKEGDDNE